MNGRLPSRSTPASESIETSPEAGGSTMVTMNGASPVTLTEPGIPSSSLPTRSSATIAGGSGLANAICSGTVSGGPTTALAAIVTAVVAAVAALVAAVVTALPIGTPRKIGKLVKNARGPAVRRRSPRPMFKNARETTGSNWDPALSATSWRASSAGIGFLYERVDVITSKASATATMRAASGISLPWRPAG